MTEDVTKAYAPGLDAGTIVTWLQDCELRFYAHRREMFCRNQEHEGWDLSGRRPFTELYEWTLDHWNCHAR